MADNGATSARIAMIGCGNLGSAIVQRWLSSATLTVDQLTACTAREHTSQQLARTLGIACSTDLARTLASADVAVLAFKPQQRALLLPRLAALPQRPLWISLLAGVPLAELQATLGGRVVRWMPNTPVAVGAGMVAQCTTAAVGADDLTTCAQLLRPLGASLGLAEAQFDAFTAVAGCGPAYVFAFCEALAAAATAQGLDEATAGEIARQTMIGAAQLLAVSSEPMAVLRQQVTSKGGMTEAALASLGAQHWAGVLDQAVAAAVAQAKQLRA